MDEKVAPLLDDQIFITEYQIENQISALPLWFPNMNKSNSATCKFFHSTIGCKLENLCPFRHVCTYVDVVCKHWLRGLCKKGDLCEFSHVYDSTKMPICYFYSVLKSCSNKECMFLHTNPQSERPECPWYNRGHCNRGPICRFRHVRRTACPNYLSGFCPDGPRCRLFHGRFLVIQQQQQQQQRTIQHVSD